MSTSNSVWTSGYGMGRSVKKAPIKILQDNDVFLPDGASIKGENGGATPSARGLALSDSSNNITRKALSNKPVEFEFKKPIAPGKSKFEKSMSCDTELSMETVPRPRSHSVPSISSENSAVNSLSTKSSTTDLDEFSHSDSDLYPEPEFFREITREDMEDYTNSPILRALETNGVDGGMPEFLRDDLLTDNEELANASDEEAEEDDLDDDLFPDIEKLPSGYATRILLEEAENARPVFPLWERNLMPPSNDDLSFPQPSEEDFQFNESFSCYKEADECPFSPAIYDDDISPPSPCYFGTESDEEESTFIR